MRAVADRFPPDHLSLGGLQESGFADSDVGRPPAGGTLVPWLFGARLGLLLELCFDELSGDLIAQSRGDRFEFGEAGAPGQAVGVEFLSELVGDLSQPLLELLVEKADVLVHVRSPTQFAELGA